MSQPTRSWERGLTATFPCAGRLVFVTLEPLRELDGRPRWDVRWSAPPASMPPALMAGFDARLKMAKASILEYMAQTVQAST